MCAHYTRQRDEDDDEAAEVERRRRMDDGPRADGANDGGHAHHDADGAADDEYEEEEDDGSAPDSDGSVRVRRPLSVRVARWWSRWRAKWTRRRSRLLAWLRELWIGQQLAVQYLLADTRREKRGLLIGTFTVLLVVMLVSLLENNVQRSPLVFWRIAETSVGEGDLMLTNGFGVNGVQSVSGDSSAISDALVHQRYVDDALSKIKTVTGSTGRWLLLARILAGNGTRAATAPAPIANGSYVPPTSTSASAYLLGIDSEVEADMGLGRSWSFPPLRGEQVYLSRSVVREIGLDPDACVGLPVLLRLDLLDVAQTLNVGGVGGGADSVEGFNTTDGHTKSSREQAEQEAREENNTPQQNRALLLRLLIERAAPNASSLWDQPVGFGNNTALVIGLIDFINNTISNMPADGSGSLVPFPGLPPWTPGQPIPPEYEPLLAIIAAQYGLDLTPDQLRALLDLLFRGAQVLPDGADVPTAWDDSPLIFEPGAIQRHLAALKNGTETYGDLLDLFTPLLLQLLRVDTTFTVAGVVNEPVRTKHRTRARTHAHWGRALCHHMPPDHDASTAALRHITPSRPCAVLVFFSLFLSRSQDGKWSEALGSVVVLENGELMKLLSTGIQRIIRLESSLNMSAPLLPPGGYAPLPSDLPVPPAPDPSQWPLERLLSLLLPGLNATRLHSGFVALDEASRSVRSNNLSLLAVVQYSDRLSVYTQTLDEMSADLLAWTNLISASGVGFDYPLMYTLPLLTALKLTMYVRYFLDNIFASVLVLLVMLGMMLIYALLLQDVDSKTFEYGMLRALGMKHQTLVQILLSKSFMYSVPGIGVGLLLAFLANIPIAQLVASFAVVPPDYAFLAAPIVVSVLLGLLMPLMANLVPISRALGKTLRDSLDVYHVVVSEVTVRVFKLQELGVDLWQTCISVLLIVVGFVTFYVSHTEGQQPARCTEEAAGSLQRA